jgi:regulator of protease activity HflC (stomatin/prohibitin superfamily)
MDTSQTLGIVLLALAGIVAAGMLFVWLSFFRPRTHAIKYGLDSIEVWMGLGTLVLWNPGETFVFQHNKEFEGAGGEKGGLRTIFPVLGQQAYGPIPLKTAMLPWEATQMLTREAQQLEIRLGAWWRVSDPEKYVFQIYQEKRQGGELPVRGVYSDKQIRTTAEQWLKVLTEAAMRSRINRMSVADVVSAQATRFLQETGDAGSGAPDSQLESKMLDVLAEVKKKLSDYGIELQRLEIQHIHLPEPIQKAIDDTRVAFLEPIKSERQAEAAMFKLRKLGELIGNDTVGLNELLKNLSGTTFVTPLVNPFQSLISAVEQRATQLPASAPKSAVAMAATAGVSGQRPSKDILPGLHACPKCSQPIERGHNFCPNCGAALNRTATAEGSAGGT